MRTMSTFTTLQVHNKEILTRSFEQLANFPTCVKHPQLMKESRESQIQQLLSKIPTSAQGNKWSLNHAMLYHKKVTDAFQYWKRPLKISSSKHQKYFSGEDKTD